MEKEQAKLARLIGFRYGRGIAWIRISGRWILPTDSPPPCPSVYTVRLRLHQSSIPAGGGGGGGGAEYVSHIR